MQQKKEIGFKSWWIVGISIFSLIVGIQGYYQLNDLQSQYNHLQSKMTVAEQIYGSMGLAGIKAQIYLFFGVSIITGIMAVVGFFWFDNRKLIYK